MKNKSKTYLKKKGKKKASLTQCLEKRKIMYPDNRKWIGNFNDLVF